MVRVSSKQRNYCHGANRKKSRNLFGVGVKSFSRVAKKTPRDKDKDSVVKRSSSCRSNRKFEKTLKKILKSQTPKKSVYKKQLRKKKKRLNAEMDKFFQRNLTDKGCIQKLKLRPNIKKRVIPIVSLNYKVEQKRKKPVFTRKPMQFVGSSSKKHRQRNRSYQVLVKKSKKVRR